MSRFTFSQNMQGLTTLLVFVAMAFPIAVQANCVNALESGEKIKRCKCRSDGSPVQVSIDFSTDRYVILDTLYNGSSQLVSKMNCGFVVGPSDRKYYIEILQTNVAEEHSMLLVQDGQDERRLMRQFGKAQTPEFYASRTGLIKVTFTTLDYPTSDGNTGYRIRLIPFQTCPPNWLHSGGHCFSSPGAIEPKLANFTTARAVCNRMRANLMVASPSVLTDMGVKELNKLASWLKITSSTWFGLASKRDADGRAKFYWIDSLHTAADLNQNWLSCRSGSARFPDDCDPNERFAYLRSTSQGFLVMDSPASVHHYICYAPISGSEPAMLIEQEPTVQLKLHPATLPEAGSNSGSVLLAGGVAFAFASLFLGFLIGIVFSNRDRLCKRTAASPNNDQYQRLPTNPVADNRNDVILVPIQERE